jgi:YD repeat-containing protein
LLIFFVASADFHKLAQAGQSATERYTYDALSRLVQATNAADQVTEYSYDAAGNLSQATGGGSLAMYAPSVTSITPNFFRRGDTKNFVIAGQRLNPGTLQTSNDALEVSKLVQSSSQIQADLKIALNAPLGAQTLTLSNAAGAATANILIGPSLPVLSAEPSPLALPPDNLGHTITLRLSSADVVSHSVNLAFSDASKASVFPASVVLSAGQTSTQVSITSKLPGFTTLLMTSPTLPSASVPVFITTDFKGINTSDAAAVGVMVGSPPDPNAPKTAPALFTNRIVGVAVGSMLTRVSPVGMPVGSEQTLVVSGNSIPAGASLSLLPATGSSFGPVTIAADGSQASALLTIDAAAPVSVRKVVVKDAAGKVLEFADPARSQIVFTTGQPTLVSIEPLYGIPGSLMQIKVRGRNLQNGSLALIPNLDVAVDTQPVINAEGTELTARVQLYPLAAPGMRVVQITTPSGQSSAVLSSSNGFTLVTQIKNEIGPIFAQPVGLVVGSVNADPLMQTIAPVNAAAVSVMVGGFASTLTPKVAVVGSTVNFVVTGVGLDAVQSVAILTPDGLTAAAFSVSADGSSLSLPVTVDALAAKTPRRIVLKTAAGRMLFSQDSQAIFLVAAPAPEVIAIAPQVIKAGSTATLAVRGKNFRDVIGVRFEPAEGLVVAQGNNSISASADGTLLSVAVAASATATTGPRTLIVMAAGGESTNQSSAANSLQVAQQVSPTYADLFAPVVGVQVGAVTPAPVSSTLDVYASSVGVLVQTLMPAVTSDTIIPASNVGIVVGTAAANLTPAAPDGFLKGASGQFTINGYGLDKVTGISVVGTTGAAGQASAAGISLGAISVNAAGSQITVPVTVSSSVASGNYGLVLSQTEGALNSKVTAVPAKALLFSVGALPTQIDSVAPIVLEQGKNYSFTLRGVGLKDVYQVQADPAAGLVFTTGAVQWSTDALGEKLSVPVTIDAATSIGSRVVRLKVPGGLSDGNATPANTITVVAPQ